MINERVVRVNSCHFMAMAGVTVPDGIRALQKYAHEQG